MAVRDALELIRPRSLGRLRRFPSPSRIAKTRYDKTLVMLILDLKTRVDCVEQGTRLASALSKQSAASDTLAVARSRPLLNEASGNSKNKVLRNRLDQSVSSKTRPEMVASRPVRRILSMPLS